MLAVNRVVHLECNVALEGVSINDLLARLRKGVGESFREAVQDFLAVLQEEHLERVLAGEAELVCTGCGEVHRGAGVVRRGWRRRAVVGLEGRLRFALRQVTCLSCQRTWSPYPELLGLAPRQRVLRELEEKLVGVVTQLSYRRTCRIAQQWLGGSMSPPTLHARVQKRAAALELTPQPDSSVIMADGTKVPAGSGAQGEDLRASFQIGEPYMEYGRARRQVRLVGLGIGLGSWSRALPATLQPSLVVTDGEPSLRAHVRKHFPKARHQLCMWHVPYGLDWSMSQEKVKVPVRRMYQAIASRILFDHRSVQRKRIRYRRLVRRMARVSPTAHKQLAQAADLLFYDQASQERTTSLAERRMRESNRRLENGSRWSPGGAFSIALLALAQTHNPDDYARLWAVS